MLCILGRQASLPFARRARKRELCLQSYVSKITRTEHFLSQNFSVHQFPSESVNVRPSPPMSVRIRQCPSESVNVRPSPPMSVRVRQCPSESANVRPSPPMSANVPKNTSVAPPPPPYNGSIYTYSTLELGNHNKIKMNPKLVKPNETCSRLVKLGVASLAISRVVIR